jgi:hypothetical protein
VGCSACAKRRKALLALKAKQKERGQVIRAAMTGAVVTVSEAAGKAIGITGEESDNETSEQTDPVSKGA